MGGSSIEDRITFWCPSLSESHSCSKSKSLHLKQREFNLDAYNFGFPF